MSRLRYIFIILILFVVACSDNEDEQNTPIPTGIAIVETVTPQPTDTPTLTPTATVTPTDLPTNTLTHTATPTNTPTAAPTSTPTATPAPEGYYRNEPAGFALIIPDSWDISSEDANSLQLMNPRTGLFFIISNVTAFGDASFEDVIDDIILGLGADGLEVESQDVLTISDGVSAERAILVDYSEDSIGVSIHLLYVQNVPQSFIILSLGSAVILDSPASPVQELYATLDFLPLSLYGLSLDQTLLEAGGDPLPTSLDPATQTGSAAGYVGLLYSGLVRLTPQLGIKADLAESWSISPDGTTYTFTLRPDLAFADGSPLTAANVKYSWERATDPEIDSETAETYLGDILGVKEKIAGDAAEISGVEVVDDRTLIVTLDAPKPYFLAKLAYPTSYVVDQRDIESGADDWMFAANASGPYQVREYLSAEAIIFERNENYHTPAQIPFVIYRFNLFGSALSLYEAGEIDFVGVGGDNLQEIQQPDHPLNDQLIATTALCTTFAQLNNTRAPFDDVDVRRAFVLATDKQLLIERFANGLPLPGETLLPPGMPGFDLTDVESTYDPAAARELLANSSYGTDLPPIVLSTFGRGDSESEFLIALATMWQEALGIEYVIEYFDPVNYATAAREIEGHVFEWGWCADYPDPENFLDILFHSEANFNLSAYSNPEYDALIEQARTELDSTARLALYHQAELLLLADGGLIPLWHGVSNQLVSPRVVGYIPTPLGVAQIHRLSLVEIE